MFTKHDYDVGTAAVLHLIQVNVANLPFYERGMIPIDKEPLAAASAAHCVLDAVAAAHKAADKAATAVPNPNPLPTPAPVAAVKEPGK